jgi:hypothetical protein
MDSTCGKHEKRTACRTVNEGVREGDYAANEKDRRGVCFEG